MDGEEVQIRVAGWVAAKGRLIEEFLVVDGIIGPKSKAAIKRFQRAHNLPTSGKADRRTTAALQRLQSPDRSTAHFSWNELRLAGAGKGISAAQTKENVRRLMWKLEALRKKAGDKPVTITSGFRSPARNAKTAKAAQNSQHMYGIAVDMTVGGKSHVQTRQLAKTCGFSGIQAYTAHTHVDSRREYKYSNGRRGGWWRPDTIGQS